jgi:hypothetical protein
MTLKLSFEEARQNLEATLERNRRTLEAKHKAEIQDLEDKYKAKLQLLDEVWSESSEGSRTPTSKSEQEDTESRRSAAGPNGSGSYAIPSTPPKYTTKRSVGDEVRIILDELRDEIAEDEIITQITVRERYVEKYPGTDNVNLRSRISHTLKQLSADNGPLELIEKGAGSEPSKYRLRSQQEEVGLLGP